MDRSQPELFEEFSMLRRPLERITDDGGIIKQLVKSGDPCKPPPDWTAASTARLHYRVFSMPLQNGNDASALYRQGQALIPMDFQESADRLKIGDSQWDGRPFDLYIGRGFQVQLFEIAVKTMRIGETSRFFCLPKYSEVKFLLFLLSKPYIQMEALLRQDRQRRHGGKHAHHTSGCMGCANVKDLKDLDAHFGCPLEFQIELIDVISAVDRTQAKTLKSSGDLQYKSGNFEAAKHAYQLALKLLKSLGGSDPASDLELKCHLNLAACHLKLGNYSQTIEHCTLALLISPSHPKALFRRAQARRLLGQDLKEAKRDLDACLAIDPSTRIDVQKELDFHKL